NIRGEIERPRLSENGGSSLSLNSFSPAFEVRNLEISLYQRWNAHGGLVTTVRKKHIGKGCRWLATARKLLECSLGLSPTRRSHTKARTSSLLLLNRRSDSSIMHALRSRREVRKEAMR
ncbi:unnamed protein product, partial [Scytosiphon promiscuus]